MQNLNSRGFKSKFGKPFGKNSLNSILKNEKYIGTFVFNKKLEKDVSEKRKPQWKPDEEIIRIPDGLPAIIDIETFNKVQAKLVRNKQIGGRYKAKEIYLLSGLIFCAECGSSMYGNTRPCGRNRSRYSSYRCSNRQQCKGCTNKELRREYLGRFVLDELYARLFYERSIKKLAVMLTDYTNKRMVRDSQELDLLQNELADVQTKIGNIIRLVAESGISMDTVKIELKKLEERKVSIENSISLIKINNNAVLINEDKVCELIRKSKDFVKTKNLAECRNFIENYVEKVLVSAERVEVFFKIDVPDKNDTVSPLKSEENIKVLQREYLKAI